MESRPHIRKNDDLEPTLPGSPAASGENASAGAGPVAPPQLPGITLNARPFSHGPQTALYRGWDRSRRRDVAVKVQRVTDNPTALARFRREAELMARLDHPGIVALYHFYEGDPAALVMEYVSGQTLLALVKASGALSPERAVKVVEEVAAALDYVHAQGIVHRDITPSNILLAHKTLLFWPGPVKLTDFGVARVEEPVPLTVMGDVLGTVEYVSPEQVHGSIPPDARSDIYSLAAVTYFALTGAPPFRPADDSTQAQLSVMHRQVFAEPPPLRLQRPELTPQIEQVVLRGLAKSPESRYASAGEFAAALRAVVEADSSQDRAAVSASRRTGVLAGGLAGAALLLGGLLLWKTERGTLPAALSGPVASSSVPPVSSSVPPVSSTPPVVVPVPAAIAPPVKLRDGRLSSLPRAARLAVTSPPAKPRRPAVRLAAVPAAAFIRRSTPPKVRRAEERREVLAAAPKTGDTRPGFLLAYASQNIAPLGSPETMASIPAGSLAIDGKPVSVPPPGGWIALPAGPHWLSFYPDAGSKFGPRTRLPITVAAGAHIRRQVLLPLALDRPVTLVADAPATALPVLPVASALSVPRSIGWYTVSGWAAVPPSSRSQPEQKPSLVRASAQQVTVDGQPNLTLALGQWAELPAGKHTIAFYPAAGLRVGPKTWDIALDPAAHLNQNIPLPSISVGWYTVSGWIVPPPAAQNQPDRQNLPSRKADLVRTSAQQVLVDGQPNLTLALGQWAELPAGKHTVTFLPTHGVGAAPKTWDIALDPLAHLNQQIPLPSLPPLP